MRDTTGRVAALGECMIQLSHRTNDGISMDFGGDTLNTAVYLARIGAQVDFVTALGEDQYSSRMIAAWQAEGVGTDLVLRVPDRLPGLYLIETEDSGERHFHYWRDRAPARDLFVLPQSPALLDSLGTYQTLYLSGISLAIWGECGRAKLFDLLDTVRAKGGTVVFDTNWRPRLWPDIAIARQAYDAMLRRTDIALPGIADLKGLYGDATVASAFARMAAVGVKETVLKLEDPGCIVQQDGLTIEVPAVRVEHVVDTTAAGDSFAAGYLGARLAGFAPKDAASAAHRLAACVVSHPGAIIPRESMPSSL